MSDRPQRTNTYTADPVNDRYRECLFDWLAAHAPLWNQITYRRRQQCFDEGGDVWDAEYTDLYDKYAPLLGKATCQQIARKNSDAWRSHFELLSQYRDQSNQGVTERPSPPGYWGNRDDGYELHGLVRNDLYTFDWNDEKSTLSFGVGEVLKDRYGLGGNERLTLEVRGDPQWRGEDSRLELIYEEHADKLRVQHPVRIQSDDVREQRQAAFTHTLDTENTTRSAAIDVGANNTLAVVTETGDTAVYHARPEFQRFQEKLERIAALQAELPDDQYTSKQIQRVYDQRSRQRDHSRDAAVKHAANWLLERNIDTMYVGDLTNALSTHWSADVNEKTHTFWSHRQLVARIKLTLGDVGITVTETDEYDRDYERIPPSSGGGRADTWPVCRWIHACGPRWHGCYGLGEMPSPNHKGWRTGGGSHGDDTESDGVIRETSSLVITKISDFRTTSLAGPQPYEGDKREFPRCVAGSLRVRVGTEGRRPPESDGRIPPPSGGGGGQSSSTCPACGSDTVTRSGDSFRCHGCELDAHSDVAGAWNLLQDEVGPMARPAALSADRGRDAPHEDEGAYWQWDEHDWTPPAFGEQSWSLDQTSVSKPASSQPG